MPDQKYNKVPEDKKKKIIKGQVRTRQKVRDIIFAETPENIIEFVKYEILWPSVKNMLATIGHGFVDTAFYGRGVRSGKYDYRGAYNASSNKSERLTYNPGRSMDSLIFETRMDAENVLDELYDRLEKYGQASVGDLYDLIGKSGNGYTDRKIGWTNLSNAKIIMTRDGFMLDLPRYKDLD